jgi:hypothetical protein
LAAARIARLMLFMILLIFEPDAGAAGTHDTLTSRDVACLNIGNFRRAKASAVPSPVR